MGGAAARLGASEGLAGCALNDTTGSLAGSTSAPQAQSNAKSRAVEVRDMAATVARFDASV